MKRVAPSYYSTFRCIRDKCRHTCCRGWEIDLDGAACARFREDPVTAPHIEAGDPPHIRLLPDESCPFLKDGLCELILSRGEDVLPEICREHPRFYNFFTDRTECGIGLVCEEAARIILSDEHPLTLVTLSDDGKGTPLPDDEAYLLSVRDELLARVGEFAGDPNGYNPSARLLEYLLYRHLPDALYDDRLEERVAFAFDLYREITEAWRKTDGTLSALADTARQISYDVEYDDTVVESRLASAGETGNPKRQ